MQNKFGNVNKVFSLTTKIEERLNKVLPVEAHAQSCVYIVVRTRIFILKQIFLFGRIVCSRQSISTSENKVRVFYAIKTYLKKYCKCTSFQVTIDLLNGENLKVAITQICKELQVCNFTIL